MTNTKKRVSLVGISLVAMILIVAGSIALLLDYWLNEKVFLASLVVLLGLMDKAVSRVVEKRASSFLPVVDKYPGANYEQRAKARNADVARLRGICFWSLLLLLSSVGFYKAAFGG